MGQADFTRGEYKDQIKFTSYAVGKSYLERLGCRVDGSSINLDGMDVGQLFQNGTLSPSSPNNTPATAEINVRNRFLEMLKSSGMGDLLE